MLKFPEAILVWLLAAGFMTGAALAQDVDAGAKVFKKCGACHSVGEGARNKVGPILNDLFGRTAGVVEGYKYSNDMIAAGKAGLVWNEETITQFVTKPKDLVKKTKMSFAGLRKEEDRVNLLAYLQTFSAAPAPEEPKAEEVKVEEPKVPETTTGAATAAASEIVAVLAKDAVVPEHGVFHLGREAMPEEIAAWDIDIRPDGLGLPEGRGTVAQGEHIFSEKCAECHGDFGEGKDRWPVLAGGFGTLKDERPEKTIGSYWPYLSTVYDYVRRAMPFGNARSLSDDDVYALTAYLMYLNDVVTDEEFELSKDNFGEIRLPNEANFIPDDRAEEAHKANKEPCMSDCMTEPAKVTMHARVLDVTPESDDGENAGGIE
jgi:cytochrome c